jgi:predicted transcriptional regulator
MRFPLESVVRPKNISFYFFIGEVLTIKEAAEDAGIAYQHGTRLVNRWRNSGLIARNLSDGPAYQYTEKGKRFRAMLASVRREFS